MNILIAVAKSAAGLVFISVAATGFLFKKMNPVQRILVILGASALLFPLSDGIPVTTWILNLLGLVLSSVVLGWDGLKKLRKT